MIQNWNIESSTDGGDWLSLIASYIQCSSLQPSAISLVKVSEPVSVPRPLANVSFLKDPTCFLSYGVDQHVAHLGTVIFFYQLLVIGRYGLSGGSKV